MPCICGEKHFLLLLGYKNASTQAPNRDTVSSPWSCFGGSSLGPALVAPDLRDILIECTIGRMESKPEKICVCVRAYKNSTTRFCRRYWTVWLVASKLVCDYLTISKQGLCRHPAGAVSPVRCITFMSSVVKKVQFLLVEGSSEKARVELQLPRIKVILC